VGIRDKLKRLEREAEGEMIVIPQQDGTVKRFPMEEGIAAFMTWMERLGAGEDAPPEHPMLVAIRNSSDPKWLNSFYNIEYPEEHTRPIEDLSE
jgi:hypothetical protein